MFVKNGAYLIDFDGLAHEVQEPEKPAWKESSITSVKKFSSRIKK